jgi:hypothetical protein
VEKKWRYDFLSAGQQSFRKYYTLSFTIHTEYEGEELQIAYGPPYTFSHLHDYITRMKLSHPKLMEVSSIGRSESGLDVPLITI